MFKNRLKSRRVEKGLTQTELGDIVGLQKSAVGKYENGKLTNPNLALIERFAAALDCDPVWLMGWDKAAVNDVDISDKIALSKRIPIIGKIAAGIPIEAIDNIEGYIDVIDKRADYGLKVNGNSMFPTIQHGDVAIVQSTNVDYNNGDIVVAILPDNGATIKRYHRYNDTIVLRPDEPSHPEIECKVGQVELRGKVIGHYGDL
jgi:repressor LexA